MNAVEKLEAAIVKLERLKASVSGTLMFGPRFGLATIYPRHAEFGDLGYRTIDAQLALLREGFVIAEHLVLPNEEAEVANFLLLANAILGDPA